MKVNLDQFLVDFEGDPLKILETDELWTLKKAVVNVLSAPIDGDRNVDPEKAVARWRLAVRLQAGGEQEVSPEEAAEIRGRLPKVYPSALLSGQACEMLKG